MGCASGGSVSDRCGLVMEDQRIEGVVEEGSARDNAEVGDVRV